MRKKRLQKIVALLMVVAMILNLTPSGLSINAAGDTPTLTANDEGTKTADDPTNTDWTDQMSEADSYSSENTGRIWTDKTVSTGDVTLSHGTLAGQSIEMSTDADFLVELSAMSSTSSLTTTTTTSAPVDVVFIIDLSGSMTDPVSSNSQTTRISALVDALNSAIDNLMTANNYNRIAVVGYSYDSVTLLALDHYSKSGTTDYFTLSGTTLKVTAVGSDGNTDTYSRSVTGGTNIQRGIYTGMNILASVENADTVVEINGTTYNRTPAVVILSDGAATYSAIDGYTTTNFMGTTTTYGGNWYNITTNTSNNSSYTNNQGNGSGTYYGNGFKAMLTAAYMKEAINRNYSEAASVYTIGVGVTSLTGNERILATLTLDPSNYSNSNSTSNSSYSWSSTYDTSNVGYLMYNAWNTYVGTTQTGTPSVTVNGNNQNNNGNGTTYTVTHPSSNDIIATGENATTTVNGVTINSGILYNDAYYDVANASDMSLVFQQITESIAASTVASPTVVEEQNETASGYVSFTDDLGQFMEVKDVNAIVVEDTIFDDKTEGTPVTNKDGSTTTTYTFTGTVKGNVVYNGGDLAHLVIKVTSYPDAATGDKVEVSIPATLLPLLYYDISTSGGVTTMTVSEDYPLRVFYSVGLKSAVRTALASGQYSSVDGLAAYVQANTDANGKVSFYSNLYDATKADGETKTVGDTTVWFEPATTNSFYYFQEATPLYSYNSASGTYSEVSYSSLQAGTTYYYQHTYYYNTTTTDPTTMETTTVTQSGTKYISVILTSDEITKYVTSDSGYAVISAGAPKLVLGEAAQFQGEKTAAENTTATADYYLYPTWTEGNNAVTYLGNNGRIQYSSTGSLAISKTVSAAANYNPSANTSFAFTVTFTNATGSYSYDIYTLNADNERVVASSGTIASGGTLSLKDGQTVEIYGLPHGAGYTVAETLPSGYTTTNVTRNGTIEGGVVATEAYTNVYKPSEVTYNGSLSASKTLTGRAWDDADSFTFYLTPVEAENTILPTYTASSTTSNGATVNVSTGTVGTSSATGVIYTVTKGTEAIAAEEAVTFDLGSFTFSEPGTYTYRVTEHAGTEAGVTYSSEIYTIVFTVEDNGQGQLTASAVMTNAAGTMVESNTAAFENTYDAGKVVFNVTANKTLNGSVALAGSYTFRFTALKSNNDAAKLPAGVTATSENTNDNEDVSWTVTNVASGRVVSGDITVEANEVGNTYEYLVEEVIPSDAVSNSDGTYTYKNNIVTFDTSVYKYSYTVTYVNGQTGYTLTVSKQNTSGGWDVISGATTASFANKAEVTIGTDTVAGIQVKKSLTGRPWQTTDSFTFKLTAADSGTPMPTGATNGEATVDITQEGATATFSQITYTAAGTYSYTLTEVEGSIAGITYDGGSVDVTVTVTDKGDYLEATVSYSTGSVPVFTNTYKSEEVVLPTADAEFQVTKVLSGRGWLSTDQFGFTLEAGSNTAGVDTPVPSQTAISANSLDQSPAFTGEVKFEKPGEYTYYIRETQGSLGGITYDATVWKVVVTIGEDYAQGKLTASVAYYKGTEANYTSGTGWNLVTGSDVLTFTNTYTATPATLSRVGGSKTMVGRDMTADEVFTFTLTPTGDTVAAVANGTVQLPGYDSAKPDNPTTATATLTGLADGQTEGFSFGTITFTKAGSYTFNITENNSGMGSDITYDSHTTKAIVTVTDNNNGTMTAVVRYENNDWNFTNVSATNTKTVESDTDGDGQTEDVDGQMLEVGQELTYTINWTNDAYANGVPAAAVVTIEDTIPTGTTLVTASVTGTLSAAEPTDEEPIVYTLTEVSGKVTGITWKIRAAAAETGSVSFKVTVSEDASSDTPITNKATVKIGNNTYQTNETTNYIPVTVENLFQVQKQIVDADGNAITGSTVYPWTVVAKLDENDNDEEYWFRFVLEAVSAPDGVTLESILPGTATGYTTDGDNHPVIAMNVYDENTHSFGSGEVTYSATGTYVYDIWERSPITAQNSSGAALTGKPISGVSYAQTLYRLTVTVTFNDEKGVLEASYTIIKVDNESGEMVDEKYYDSAEASGSNVMVIKNTYNRDEEEIAFRGIKLYTDESGATELTEGKFTFKFTTLTADTPVPTPAADSKISVVTNADGTKSWTVENATNGEFNSTSITYTSADKGTYYYKVEEIRPDGATDQDANKAGFQYQNMTYDTNVYYIQVVVSYVDTDIDTDDIADTVVVNYLYGTMDNGTFTAGGVPETDFGRIEFKNVYDPTDVEVETADTEAGFGLTKTIEGREWLSSDTFTFTLTADAGTPMPEGYSTSTDGKTVTVTATVKGSDAKNGSVAIDFGTITYSKVGTYTYTVTENATDIKGITIDGETRVITVVVKHDDQKNALYIDSLTVELATAGASVDPADEPGANPAADEPTAENTATVFTNTYESTGSTDEGTDLTKTLTGRTMDANEFTFVITAVAGKDNNLGAASDKLAAAGLTRTGSYTVTNETGNVASDAMKILDNLTFTQADAGATYTYTVAEQLPTDDEGNTLTKLNGVTYDQTAYLVEIYVQDNNDGTIKPKVTVYKTQDETGASAQKADSTYPTANEISFANTYAATGKLDGAANLKVAKTLTGRNGGSNETFTFQITALNDGDPMPEANAETDAGGDTVYVIRVNAPATDGETSYGAFGDITFTKAGTYYYTISEVEGTNVISTWSRAEYQVTVEVTDNRDGTLKVEVTEFILSVDAKGNETDADDPSIYVTDATASFTNSYEEPKQTKDVADITEPTTSVNGKVVAVGDTLTYTINWTNTAIDADGNAADATEVVVTDTMPEGTAYVQNSAKVTVKNVNGGVYNEPNVTISYNNGVLTCTIKDVKANETGTVTFDVTVEESAKTVNTLTNTASIEIGGGETKVDASTNPVTNYVPKDPVKAIAESSDGYTANPTYDETTDTYTYSEVAVNDTIEYVISYYNHNPEAAEVTITDTLDAGVAYVEGSATNGGIYNDATRTITWKLSGVAAFTAGTVSFKVTVTEDAKKITANEKTATVENSASVQIGNASAVDTSIVENPVNPEDPKDPAKTVSSSSAAGYDANAAVDETTNTLTGSTVAVGSVVSYDISYYNNNNTVADVIITDRLDEGVDFVKASDGGEYNEAEHTVTWTLKNVAPFTGGTVLLEVQVNVKAKETEPGEDATIDNQASVKIGNEAAVDTNIVENPIDPDDPEEPSKVVAADSAGADGADVKVGDSVTYIIGYYNHNNTPADVIITDTLDKGVDFVKASDGGEYDPQTRTVTWNLKNVKAFGEGTVSLTVTVNENAKKIESGETQATVENKASVQIGNETAVDTNIPENPVTPDDPEDPVKNVSAASPSGKDTETTDPETGKITGSSVAVSDIVEYEISYYNNNNTVADVIITDKLDDGVDFVEASAGGEYDEATHTVTWTLKNVAPFTGGIVLLQVQVNEKAKETIAVEDATIENQASVQIGNETAVDTNVVENPIDPDDPENPSKVVAADSEGADNADVKVGDEITYIITYYNHNSTAADITITDVLDPGVDFVSADGGTYDEATHKVIWTLKNVKAFGEGYVTLTVQVNANAKQVKEDEDTATVKNTASVQIGNESAVDSNPVENPVTPDDPENPTKTISSGSETGYYDEDGKVAVETGEDGTVTGGTVGVGGIIEYVIGYYNYENTTATITITDELDPGVMFVSAEGVEVTDISTVDTEAVGDSYVTYRVETTTDAAGNEVTTVIWTVFNVKPFTEGSVLLQVEVLESAKTPAEGEETATVENDATVVNSEDPDNTYTSNVVVNEISPDEPGDPAKMVTADSKAGVDGAAVDVGEEITYAITYYNHNQTTADVTITDALDIGVEFVGASNGGVYDEATHIVTWNISDVTAFTGGFVTVTVRVTEAALKLDPGDTMGDVENQAEVQVGDIINSTNIVVNPIAPDEPEEPTKIVDDSELVEIDEDGNYVYESVGIYDTITYEIEYYNHHNEIAIIEIIDKLDEGVDFITASGVKAEDATDSDSVTWVYDGETHTVTWTIVELPWNGGTVSVTVQVNESAKLVETGEVIATVENEATVIVAPDMEHETTMDSNKVINPVDPDQPADPSKVVVSDVGSEGSDVAVGDELTYRITWYNYNNEASDVTIVDVLDTGVDFVKATGTEKSKATDADTVVYEVTTDADGKVTVIWTITGADPFTAGSVELTVKVNENAKKIGGDETQATVANTASVQIGNDTAVDTNTTENPITPDDPADPTKTITTEGVEEGDTVKAGDVLTYEIGFYNHTNKVATVTVTDALDSGVDYQSGTDGGVYDEATHTVTWTLTVDPFTEGSVSVTVKVNETAAAQVSNTAYVKIGNDADSDVTTGTDVDVPDNGTPTNTVTNPVEEEEAPTPAPTEPVSTTSDTEAVVPYTVLMLMAFAAIVILLKSRRRENA